MDDLLVVLVPALAMGLGWGVRGQFGHESGAMVPGALVGLALAVVAGLDMSAEQAVRIGAVGALACSLGGVMTYGQTVGLVHNRPRAITRSWGFLGLAVKGGVWIGLTGAFIGMAASHVTYTPGEVGALCLGLALAAYVGLRTLNRPHDPGTALPAIYFSKRDDSRPRPEFWGGLWLAFAVLLAYLIFAKSDDLAVGLALFGTLGGALGFPVGEWLQAWGRHRMPFGWRAQPWMDWWKVMEVSFGVLGGAALGLGWMLLRPGVPVHASTTIGSRLSIEALAMAAWFAWLVAAEVGVAWANRIWEASFVAIILPMAVVFGGGVWAVLVILPLLLWLSGDNLVFRRVGESGSVHRVWGWVALGLVTAASGIAAAFACRGGLSPWGWLATLVGVQTALALVWTSVGRTGLLARVAGRQRPGADPALPVDMTFLTMAAMLLIVTHEMAAPWR